MRGLPPPPPDVALLVQEFSINGARATIGFWLFNPSMTSLEPASAARLLGDWFTDCLGSLLELMHSGASATTCHLSGSAFRYVDAAPPNHGAWTGGQAMNVATGLHWLNGERRPFGGKITYVPAVPDVFISNNWQINELAYGNLKASGEDLLAALNGLRSPDGTPTVVGTVHRSAGGRPLGVSTFAPYIGVVPTSKVVTIRRRIPHAGALLPS